MGVAFFCAGGGGAGRLGGGVPYFVVLPVSECLVGRVLVLESITWVLCCEVWLSFISRLSTGFGVGG